MRAGAGQQADQQQPAVAVGEAGPAPDVGEEVVGGVAEEVARRRRSCRSRRPAPSSPGRGGAASGRSSNLPMLVREPSPFARRSRASARERYVDAERRRPARSRRPGPSPPARRTWSKTPCQKSSGASGAVVSRCMIAPGPAGDRVGVPDHLAELDQVEPGRLGQPLRLGRGGEGDEVHQVAGQLELGAGADRAGVDDLASPSRRAPARAAANAASEPPTMIASVPSAAPIAPPLTGASTHLHAVAAGGVLELARACPARPWSG